MTQPRSGRASLATLCLFVFLACDSQSPHIDADPDTIDADIEVSETDSDPDQIDADPDEDIEADSDADVEADVEVDPCLAPEGELVFDEYGGDTRVELEATGFFRVELLCGRYWLVTPEGHPFYSIGVNHITASGDMDPESEERLYQETVDKIYKSRDEFADTTVERLRSWGFNTAGCWSDSGLFSPRMPITIGMGLSGGSWLTGTVADYFDPAWVEYVEERAQSAEQYRDNPNIIGYFIDNEIHWGPDWRGNETLLQVYLGFEPDAPGKIEAVDFLFDELSDLSSINEFLGTEFSTREELLAATAGWSRLSQGASDQEAELTSGFLRLAADRYFSVTTSALRTVDPNHLILGNREVSIMTRVEVYQAAEPYLDVLSINNYIFPDIIRDTMMALSGSLDPCDGFLALHDQVDLPILITEIGFRARDSGLPNTWPPIYPTYETQEERADAATEYFRFHQSVPWIVGYHWFEWVDQPMGGRFDGEDNNWGLVSELDEPYETTVNRLSEINREVWDLLRLDPATD